MKLPGRHVCILADMLEMGEEGPSMHFEVGSYAREKGIELVVACGELGRKIAEGAGEKGMYFENAKLLEEALAEFIQKGDNVLVKASRGMHLETVAEAIKLLME